MASTPPAAPTMARNHPGVWGVLAALSTLVDEDAMKTKLIASVASIGFTTLGVTGLAFAQDNANRQSGNPATERMEKGNANEGAQRKMNERPAQTGQIAAPEKREGETRTGQNMQGEKREGETRTGQTPRAKSAKARPEPARPARAKSAKARPEPARPRRARSAKARPAPARPRRARSAKARPAPARPPRAKSAKARPEPARPPRAKSAKARPEPARPRKEGIAKARLPEARGTSASGETSTFPAKTPPAYQKIWSDRATARTSTSTSTLERRCRGT